MRKRKGKAREASEAPASRRITPVDIQQKEFRLSFRGYKEREVDEFLDELTESVHALMEENRELGERLERLEGAGVGTEDAAREAEAILSRAREDAATIVREAEERAEGSVLPGELSAADRQAVAAFIGREREFLRSLASLIQGHAETVKELAREARERARAEIETEAEPLAPEPPAAEPPAAEPPAAGPPAAEPPAAEPPAAGPPTPQPPALESTVRLPEAAPEGALTEAEAGGAEGVEERDRSLRELFWGEE